MGGYSDIYSDLYDPAFPQSILDTRVELLLGGTWTDVGSGSRVYERDQVTITRGHPDEASAVNPSLARLTVNNRDGRFSPKNPNGLYYGLIGRNTPLRISVPEGSTFLRLEDDATGYVSCPDKPALDITGDMEIQVDLQLSGYTWSDIASKDSTSVTGSWTLGIIDDGTLRFYWNNPGGGTVVNSTAPLPLGRIAVKVTLAAASGTVTFYTAPTISGSWTQLGAAVVTGATSVITSTVPLRVGANAELTALGMASSTQSARHGMTGKVFAFKLLNGIGGTTVASPTFAGLPAGTAPFADAQANIWSFSGPAQISDRKYKHHGEVSAWPQRWDVTGADVYAPIEASGLLRRLGMGGSAGAPLNSALYRAYVRLTGSTAPIAYWPCEDAASSTRLASALGALPMSIQGTANLASDSSFLCSQNLPVVNNSVWTGVVPAAATAANVLRFLVKVPSSSPPADGAVLARLYTYGTVTRTDLIYRLAGGLQLKGYDHTGNTLFDTGAFAFGILDKLLRASVELQQVGGNVQYSITTVAPGANTGGNVTGTVAGSIGAAYQVWIGPDANLSQVVIGHVTVQAAWDSLFNIASALNAWQGETAGLRFARLCAEEGVPSRVYGHPADSTAMGPQRPLKLTDLLQECEDADKGLITDPRQTLALGYRTRASMYNQAAAVTLNYTAAHLSPPIEPTEDDRFTANDVTATRTYGGSSSRQILTSGSMSTQAPPTGVGPYPSAASVNLNLDTQLDDAAGWLVHLGTVDEPRYPSLAVNLARSELAALFYALQDLDVGDRLAVINTPSWLPPDGISQIVRGISEVCYGYTYTIAWVCAPESAYRVAVYDDAVLGHYDTDGSQVQGNYSSSAPSIQVSTTNPTSPLWTTSAGDFPFDIEAGGERMTVTTITGSSSPQTFTVTRSVNGVVKSQINGTDVRLFQPAVYSM